MYAYCLLEMMCFIVYMCLVLQLIKLRMFSTTGNNDMVCVYSIAHDLCRVLLILAGNFMRIKRFET